MTPDELRDRILGWDDPHTDLKEVVDNNGELAKDLMCFANSDGGQLMIGIAKARSVVGVPDTDRLLLRVDDVAFQSCAPSLTVVRGQTGPERDDRQGWVHLLSASDGGSSRITRELP